MTSAAATTRTLTTTEAAVLSLLAISGERSGYDLLKQLSRAIGYVWSPAKSQLYAVLSRLERDRLAESRAVAQTSRPDKQLFRITDEGRAAVDEWLATPEPGSVERFYLKLFVGGLTTHDVLVRHGEQFRSESLEQLDELRAVEATNLRTGNDRFHYFLLRLGIERAEQSIAWADWVLDDLRGGDE
jgi:PadR family transcriptional regulator, regulatory protein AphA